MPWYGLNIEIYDINHYSCFHKKVFLYEVEPFWSLLSHIYIPLFKVNFHHTGCPKEWKMQWNWLKFEIYGLTLSLTGIARPWLLRGGADSAPRSNWMKEGTETQHCYLEVGHLSKWRSHAKIWAPISKIERDFKIFRKSQLSWKKIVFGQKRLPFSQFLIFFVLVFCKQSHFHSV